MSSPPPHRPHPYPFCRCQFGRQPSPLPGTESDPGKREIRTLLRIVAGVLVGIFCLVAILFSLWALLQPSPPAFGVSSGSLSNFNLTEHGLSSTWAFVIAAHNPNNVGRVFYYNNFLVSLSYDKDYSLAEAHVGPFSQPGKNWTMVQAQLVAVAQYLNDDVRRMMEVEWSRGVIEFNVEVRAEIRLETVLVRMPTRWEAVVCTRVKFELYGVVGSMVEASPISCKGSHQKRVMGFVLWFLIFFIFLFLLSYVFF